MRQFIRHPLDIPIEIRPGVDPVKAYSVGSGGLAFRSPWAFAAGELVHIRIAYMSPAFDSDARVVWCNPAGNEFELGIEFLDSDDAFKARMVEQLCHIENYRHSVKRSEGRDLSTEEAALEWIGKYAAIFPGN